MKGCLSFVKIPFKAVVALLTTLGGFIGYIFDKESNFNSVKHILYFTIDAWFWFSKTPWYSDRPFKKGILKGKLHFIGVGVSHAVLAFLTIFVIVDYLMDKDSYFESMKEAIKYYFKTSFTKTVGVG
jgi:hypothetical protein